MTIADDPMAPDLPPGERMLGRKPIKPHSERFAIGWLHEYDPEVAPGSTVVYPVDVSKGITAWGMLGNGPDPTLTITTVNGPGQPVGDCYFAGEAHDTMLAGSDPTSNQVAGEYDVYSDEFSGGQDDGVVVADALLWQKNRGEIELFAPVHPDTLGPVMAKYKRGILLGVNLTPCDQNSFPTWSVGPGCQPDPSLGHVVYLVKLYGPIGTGAGAPVSWGQLVAADPAWLSACPEEWWILLTSADRAAMGEAAYDALAADLAAIPGATGTPPVPSPVPPAPPAPPAPPGPPPTPTPEVISWWEEMLAWLRSHL